jgi:uncharacterized protein
MSRDNSRSRVVFDCMIYLQATISKSGPAAKLLRLVDSNALSLFVSTEILAEVHDVLSRPKIRERNPQLTEERVTAFIMRISDRATVIDDISSRFEYARDPKDEKYINLAIEVEADYIISRDTDLLDLMTGYTDECKDLRRRFRPLKIIEPIELLEIIEAEASSEPSD